MNHPFLKTPFTPFLGRRSVVHSLNGIVACSQPLAAAAGQTILSQGGNAADAAVAVAAALNVTEPGSTGIGGDMFCLFYNGQTRQVHSLNGSGRSPSSLTLEKTRRILNIAPDDDAFATTIPLNSVLAVTTPGAAAGWVDTVERLGSGKLSLRQILEPAIQLGEGGFLVSEVSSRLWQEHEQSLRDNSPNFRELLKPDATAPDGVRAPLPGEIMTNPGLAQTFRTLAAEGKDGFYKGRIADAIVQVVQDLGGFLSHDDLSYHAERSSDSVDPIHIRFNESGDSNFPSLDIWEHPPNGQGIVALMALRMLEELAQAQKRIPSFKDLQHNSTDYIHALIEVFRIAFSDASWWVSDPDNTASSVVPNLLDKSYLAQRTATFFDPLHASNIIPHGSNSNSSSPALNACDTVYFAITDTHGNAISFVNSNYHGFGTAIVPANCGFTLQSRGANFSLCPNHPNALAPRKRPYHTIIPAIATNAADGSLHSVFGVMGGFMQPQGQVQVLLNMVLFGFNAQQALDAPRLCIGSRGHSGEEDRTVFVEEGIDEDVLMELRMRGHDVKVLREWEREMFGRGQIICSRAEGEKRVYSAGSDCRADGMAIPL